jgi:hypothetical protein
VAGSDGRVWLQTGLVPGQPKTWQVLGPDGRVSATARTPPGVTGMAATADHFWGIQADELGVLYIVRYRITQPGAPVRPAG